MPREVLKPGLYTIRATIRQTIQVEEGAEITERDLIDEIIFDPAAELVDWEISGGGA